MEFKYYVYCLATVVLIATSFIFGLKFIKRRNFLLGGELWVVTFSATNLLINALTEAPLFLQVSLFCDAFSRCLGIPIIAIAGLAAASNRFRPSTFMDLVLFSMGAVVTVIVWTADFLTASKPYFYLVMWSVFSAYLVYFAIKLIRANERLQALNILAAMISAQAIASIYDFYRIPGDDDHVIFYTFALLTWSFLGIAMYYGYCALERAQKQAYSSI